MIVDSWQDAHSAIHRCLDQDPRLNPFDAPRSEDIDAFRREWERFGELQIRAEAEHMQRQWRQTIDRVSQPDSDDEDFSGPPNAPEMGADNQS